MKFTARVLLFGFLFQPLLVYWSSPWFYVNTSTGLMEVTCTLKGEARHDLHSDSLRTEKLAEDKYCSALKLVDMANSTLHLAVPTYHSQTLYLIGFVEQPIFHQYLVLHYNSYLTRAPPQLS